MRKLRVALAACFLGTCAAPNAYAVPIDVSKVAQIDFNFVGAQPPPPYQNINFQLFFGTDDFTQGDAFTIQAFQSGGIAVSNPLTIISPFTSTGGEIESGFGGPSGLFFGSLTGSDGFLLVSNVTGTFDLTGAKVLAADLNYFPPGTPWIDATVSVRSAVDLPEPATLALFSSGLAGAIAIRRRKKGLLNRNHALRA